MSGRRSEWIVLAVLIAMLAIVTLLVGDRGADNERESRPNPSTYNAKGTGGKGLYLWLQEVGLRVRRWERPLAGLPPEAKVLLVLGPRLPVEEPELRAVEEWVRGGGVLVLADDTVGGPVAGVRDGAPALRFGLLPRLGRPVDSLRPAFPSAYAVGVEEIRPEGRVRFQRRTPEGWAPLYTAEGGDVLAFKRLGKGTLILLADPTLFNNARLETADHARLALNILRPPAPNGVVLVDEFHHGHGRQDGFFRYLGSTSAPWLLAQAGLVFLALLLARGTRFGPPVPAGDTTRASSLEYVSALGDLYRRAGARRLTAETLAASLRRRLTEALGAQIDEEDTGLGRRAAGRLAMKAEQVKACLVPGAGPAASDEALLAYARRVNRLEEHLRRRTQPGRTGRMR